MAIRQMALSNRTFGTLKVTRDTAFWDRDLTGFGVRVNPTGGKVYAAQARQPKRPEEPKDRSKLMRAISSAMLERTITRNYNPKCL